MSKLNITEDGHIQFKKPEENIYSKTEWKVTFKPGFGDHPIVVNADTTTEAKNMALAEYRRKTGSVESVDPFGIEDIIAKVERNYKD